jgi:hypothetical protein
VRGADDEQARADLTDGTVKELEPYCVGGGGGCERMQSSPYAELAGVTVAVIGLAGYVAVLDSLALPDRSLTAFARYVAGEGLSERDVREITDEATSRGRQTRPDVA